MPFYRVVPIVLVLSMLPSSRDAYSDSGQSLRVDMAATFSRIEQQAKTEVGAERGQRLVEETGVGADLVAIYRVHPFLSVGGFTQLDLGTRRAGQFDGFDTNGQARLANRSGGTYREWWTGPLVRANYRSVFVELGYGLFTYRWDDGRSDLPAEDGDTKSAFRTMRSVSWRMAIGGEVPLTDDIDLVARLIWRIRYYDRRANAKLANDMVHGTQSYQPFVGVAWRPW